MGDQLAMESSLVPSDTQHAAAGAQEEGGEHPGFFGGWAAAGTRIACRPSGNSVEATICALAGAPKASHAGLGARMGPVLALTALVGPTQH